MSSRNWVRSTTFAATLLLALVPVLAEAEPTIAPELLPTEASEDAFQPPEGLRGGWYARIETSMGRIIARLLPDQAPQAVAYFARLAEGELDWVDPVTGETMSGHYYDGVKVHYAKAGFQFEAGDRYGRGTSPPLIWIAETPDGPVTFNLPGRLGMTRGTLGKISGVQFFITASQQPKMIRRYPCFGEVVSGSDVVFDITAVPTYGNGLPVNDVVIEKIRIFKIGEPKPIPEPVPYQPTPATPQPLIRD
jgi:peptidyl-prolyl cis-trans isomerase A (cyclophilin A)